MDNTAFFKLGYGLYVVTAQEGGRDNGCIVNAVMQITDTPKRLAVAVNKANFTCEMISKSRKLCVSVLSESVPFDVFQRFGFQSGRNTDKFSGFSGVKRTDSGLLYLTEHTNAYLCGTVYAEFNFDTHLLFIIDVDEAEELSQEPSVTYDYYHKHIKPKPESKQKKGYRCKICGYVYEGEPLPEDFICPLCKHPASDFEKL